MGDELARIRVRVDGRVQGVGFRAQTRRRARSLEVSGWVANRPDGSVEAVFEGPRDRVESMVEWVRRGPPGASVDRVEEVPEAPAGAEGFHIEFAERPPG